MVDVFSEEDVGWLLDDEDGGWCLGFLFRVI